MGSIKFTNKFHNFQKDLGLGSGIGIGLVLFSKDSRVHYLNLKQCVGKVLFYVKLHVKLPQIFTILREYSRNVRSVKFHIRRENSRYNCAAFHYFT